MKFLSQLKYQFAIAEHASYWLGTCLFCLVSECKIFLRTLIIQEG